MNTFAHITHTHLYTRAKKKGSWFLDTCHLLTTPIITTSLLHISPFALSMQSKAHLLHFFFGLLTERDHLYLFLLCLNLQNSLISTSITEIICLFALPHVSVCTARPSHFCLFSLSLSYSVNVLYFSPSTLFCARVAICCQCFYIVADCYHYQ